MNKNVQNSEIYMKFTGGEVGSQTVYPLAIKFILLLILKGKEDLFFFLKNYLDGLVSILHLEMMMHQVLLRIILIH